MKIYDLNNLSFETERRSVPENGTLVMCRGQRGIVRKPYVDGKAKVYLLGNDDLPYAIVPFSFTSCKEIPMPEGYTKKYGDKLCKEFSWNFHTYSPNGINKTIKNEN